MQIQICFSYQKWRRDIRISRDRRTLRSTEILVFTIDGIFWSSRSTEFWNFAIDGIFVLAIDGILCFFFIDGIFNARDRWNFPCSRSTEFLFSRSTNQAIALSDGWIKRSKILITLKICDREFSRNWNSGIPEKREKRAKKILAKNGAPNTFFKAFFFTNPRAWDKRAMSPF